jgi:hypothetical protein
MLSVVLSDFQVFEIHFFCSLLGQLKPFQQEIEQGRIFHVFIAAEVAREAFIIIFLFDFIVVFKSILFCTLLITPSPSTIAVAANVIAAIADGFATTIARKEIDAHDRS